MISRGPHAIVRRILTSLHEGPATVTELAAGYGLPRRIVSGGMDHTMKKGYVRTGPRVEVGAYRPLKLLRNNAAGDRQAKEGIQEGFAR